MSAIGRKEKWHMWYYVPVCVESICVYIKATWKYSHQLEIYSTVILCSLSSHLLDLRVLVTFKHFSRLLYFPFLLPLPLLASLPGQLKQPPNWSLVMNLVQLNLVLPPFPCQSRSIQGYLTCKPKLFIDTLLPTIHNPESLPWSKGLAKLGFNYFSCPSPPHELSCNPN